MRILLFTGKGGTGKTTVAAATALRAAERGHKTLVLSTDPAHSLADALDRELGPEPQQVAPNLFAQELDVYYSMCKYWGHIRELMLTLFRWQGVDRVLAEELSVLPGMEEASAFLWIDQYVADREYDLLVIDSAPTGETLTLLTMPHATHWWMTKTFPMHSMWVKSMGAMVRGTTGLPVDLGYAELEQLLDKLQHVQGVLTDPDISSIRLVTNPEGMVIKEAKRAFSYLSLYGYPVDALVINRIWPDMPAPGAFEGYLERQSNRLQEIEEDFGSLPILRVEHLGEEVFGFDPLTRVATALYGDIDPSSVLHREELLHFESKNGGYEIRLKLPFLRSDRFTLRKFGDELVLQLSNRRKTFFLPKFTQLLALGEYRYDSPWLIIELTAPARESRRDAV